MIVGLDIGGTKIHAASFVGGLKPVDHVRVETRYRDATEIADAAVAAIDRLRNRSGADSELDGIGIGIPGRVDPNSGVVRHAVNLEIGDEPLDILRRVQEEHVVPVFLENDVNAAALGAYEMVRHDRPIESLAYVSVGTGIGAGIVLGGEIYRGHHGVVGEIGHFPTSGLPTRCSCGLAGCMETTASGRAIDNAWQPNSGLSSASHLFNSASAGDEYAKGIADQVADQLALGVYLLAITFDTETTVVGGGVADVGGPFLEAIQAGIDRLAAQSEFIESLDLGKRLMLNPSADAGVIGAAAVAAHGLSDTSVR